MQAPFGASDQSQDRTGVAGVVSRLATGWAICGGLVLIAVVLVNVATVVPGNVARGNPRVNGSVTLYDDVTGELSGLVDFHLVTKWKTAGDSLLAARKLARPDSRNILPTRSGP